MSAFRNMKVEKMEGRKKKFMRKLKRALNFSPDIVPEIKAEYKRLTRRKKRAFESKNRDHMLNLLHSNASGQFWRKLSARKSDCPLKPRPQASTFFTVSLIERAIQKLNTGKAKDCEELQAEMIIHGAKTLAPVVADRFNEAICIGFPLVWSNNVIKPIHKAGDFMNPTNYRLIMIGHVMAKLYGSTLEMVLSDFAENYSLRAKGQAGFRKTFSTIDHIFSLRAIIEEAKARSRLLCQDCPNYERIQSKRR